MEAQTMTTPPTGKHALAVDIERRLLEEMVERRSADVLGGSTFRLIADKAWYMAQLYMVERELCRCLPGDEAAKVITSSPGAWFIAIEDPFSVRQVHVYPAEGGGDWILSIAPLGSEDAVADGLELPIGQDWQRVASAVTTILVAIDFYRGEASVVIPAPR